MWISYFNMRWPHGFPFPYLDSLLFWLEFAVWFICPIAFILNIYGLMQERCNSSALALELHLSCINPSIYVLFHFCVHCIYNPIPLKLGSKQKGCNVSDIIKCIILTKNVWILFKIWLKYITLSLISNETILVPVMMWWQTDLLSKVDDATWYY